jgi:5-methylcytosine-specific restriction enzyme A
VPWKAKTLRPIGWIPPDRRRPDSNQRGYGRQWRKLRARILERDPICTKCGKEPSNTVDHILTKARGGTDAEDNLRGMCRRCHSKKTVLVDDRWGRGR